MKKYKYFFWSDSSMGLGPGPAILYIRARSKEHAYRKLRAKGMKDDPDFIRGDVVEVKEFVQPKRIPVI